MPHQNFKPFDLEKAKAGAKVVTRDGDSVRIICFDWRANVHIHPRVIGLVNNPTTGNESLMSWESVGKYVHSINANHNLDLMMAPVKVTRVLLIVDDPEAGILTRLFDSDDAVNYFCQANGYSEQNGRIKYEKVVEWEE